MATIVLAKYAATPFAWFSGLEDRWVGEGEAKGTALALKDVETTLNGNYERVKVFGKKRLIRSSDNRDFPPVK